MLLPHWEVYIVGEKRVHGFEGAWEEEYGGREVAGGKEKGGIL